MGPEEYRGVWRFIIVIVSMVEVLFFSGIIYGWGALVYVLKDEGFLLELCQNQNLNGSKGLHSNHSDEECSQRDARFNLYFTMISSIGVLLILIVGHTFTKFGTRRTRFIFITTFSSGCLCVAFAEAEHPWLVCIGGTLMIGSGYVYIITSTQFTMLFPGHSSTIVGLMNGMKVSSSFMQQLVKIAYDNGISRQVSYFALFGFTCLTFLTTIFLYPRDILNDKQKSKEYEIKNETEKNNKLTVVQEHKSNLKTISSHVQEGTNTKGDNDTVHNTLKEEKEITKPFPHILKDVSIVKVGKGSSEKSGIANSGFVLNGSFSNVNGFSKINEDIKKGNGVVNAEGKDTENRKVDTENDAGSSDGKIKSTNCSKERDTDLSDNENQNGLLRRNMCGYLYLFNVLWFTVIRFRTNYFYGTINPLIEDVTSHDAEKVSYFTDILSYSMAMGILTCILVGVLYDWQRRFFSNIENVKERRVMSSVSPLITTCIVSVVLSSLVFVKDEAVLYPLTIIFTFFRSLLTTVGNTFLVDMFPASIYGTIYGTRFVIANIFSLIQYALYQWSLTYDGAGVHVNIFVLCLCLTTFIHPGSILISNRRKKKEIVTHL